MKSDKIIIYSKGLVHCSACIIKTMTKKEIEQEINMLNPTGISSSWKISKEKFSSGENNPCQCEQDKDRKHYLFVC